jgi:polyisoprenoid-binding protein YceI
MNRSDDVTTRSLDLAEFATTGQGKWTLDSAASAVEFHVKHFWGAITVRGHFEKIEGSGTVGADGTIGGELRIDAASLTTKNKQRDKHLRSSDFFDVERHPEVVVTVRRIAAQPDGTLRAEITLEAAGYRQELQPTVELADADSGSVTLRAQLLVDRRKFGMTWSPMKIASFDARGVVTVRFVRQ